MRRCALVGAVVLWVGAGVPADARVVKVGAGGEREPAAMDRDLMEVTVPRLEAMYRGHRYTVAQVTRWYLDRIARYDGTYKAMIAVDAAGAMARAAEEDRAGTSKRDALWGVPIVVKANTSIAGKVTSAGWEGYARPGHELVAPKDAMVVARLKAAGAVILGQTNMPDFAASDTTMSTAGGRTGDAYDERFSPGGSSGGTATAVAGNFCVLGTGTDTANSVRQPAANSSLVGMLPTRGLTSIAGIEPLDWLRDNTGPLARTVTDAAIALGVMQAEDPLDALTAGSAGRREAGDYVPYLKADALKGKRFAVPWFILEGSPDVYAGKADAPPFGGAVYPETRTVFLKSVEQMRAAGATVLIDKEILPESFLGIVKRMNTRAYRQEGVDMFLREFGPAEYHSLAEWERNVEAKTGGAGFPAYMTGGLWPGEAGEAVAQRPFAGDAAAERDFFGPQREALDVYQSTMQLWHLEGFVYPALQEPTFDEVAPGSRQDGPHSETGWVNEIGVPAVSVPGGFYADGLPFGLEMSGVRWKDGDLLGYAYAYEQATHNRRPPRLVEQHPSQKSVDSINR